MGEAGECGLGGEAWCQGAQDKLSAKRHGVCRRRVCQVWVFRCVWRHAGLCSGRPMQGVTDCPAVLVGLKMRPQPHLPDLRPCSRAARWGPAGGRWHMGTRRARWRHIHSTHRVGPLPLCSGERTAQSTARAARDQPASSSAPTPPPSCAPSPMPPSRRPTQPRPRPRVCLQRPPTPHTLGSYFPPGPNSL